MKSWGPIAILCFTVLAGMAVIVGAPPYVEMPVRGILGLGFAAAMAAVMLGPIGKAIGRQLTGDPQSRTLSEPSAQFDALMGELQALREDMAQIHERMDFTERLLAQRTERPALPREG
jgi:hypothetical protein